MSFHHDQQLVSALRRLRAALQPPESALRRILASLPDERDARAQVSWLRMFWASGGRALVPLGVTAALFVLLVWPRMLNPDTGLKVMAPSVMETGDAGSMELRTPLMFKTEALDLAVIQQEAQTATALAASDVPLSAAVVDDRALRPAEARFKDLTRNLERLRNTRKNMTSVETDMADVAQVLQDARARIRNAGDKQAELRDIARQVSRAFAIMLDTARQMQ